MVVRPSDAVSSKRSFKSAFHPPPLHEFLLATGCASSHDKDLRLGGVSLPLAPQDGQAGLDPETAARVPNMSLNAGTTTAWASNQLHAMFVVPLSSGRRA